MFTFETQNLTSAVLLIVKESYLNVSKLAKSVEDKSTAFLDYPIPSYRAVFYPQINYFN